MHLMKTRSIIRVNRQFLVAQLDPQMTNFPRFVYVIIVLFRTVISLDPLQFAQLRLVQILIETIVHQLFHYNQIPETNDRNLSETFRGTARIQIRR